MRDPRPISGTTEVDNFLGAAKPFSYKYKNPADSPSQDPSKAGGRWLGTMAQSLERDPYGKQVVENTPHGKILEMKPLVSALTAGAGRLHERVDSHEHDLSKVHGLLHLHNMHMHHMKQQLDQHGQMLAKLHDVLKGKFGP